MLLSGRARQGLGSGDKETKVVCRRAALSSMSKFACVQEGRFQRPAPTASTRQPASRTTYLLLAIPHVLRVLNARTPPVAARYPRWPTKRGEVEALEKETAECRKKATSRFRMGKVPRSRGSSEGYERMSTIEGTVCRTSPVIGTFEVLRTESRPSVRTEDFFLRNIMHGYRDSEHGSEGQDVRSDMSINRSAVVCAPVRHHLVHV